MISFGWYAHCLYAHIYLDPRKKDYWEMVVHHIAALSLIYLALVKGYDTTVESANRPPCFPLFLSILFKISTEKQN